jgi:hypothetical protein
VRQPAWKELTRNRRKAGDEHAIRRARERYGIALSTLDIRRLCRDLHEGIGTVLVEQGDDREVVETTLISESVPRVNIVIVYDRTKRIIRTFLPPRVDKSVDEYVDRLSEFYGW